MDYQAIIDAHYPDDTPLRRLLIRHSRQVADRCSEVVARHPELGLDARFLEEAAMLHDIGICFCHAPTIFCHGDLPYICHGTAGARLLRQAGHERHARVCERHTGAGITAAQIRAQHLPLPEADLVPETLEEQVVCYADKFFSKSHPDRQLTAAQAAQSLERFGSDGAARFMSWHTMFG